MHGTDAMSAQPPVQPVGPAPESPPMAHAGARAVAPSRVANVEAVARSRRLTMAADGPLLRLLGGVVDKCIAQADGRGAWHGSRSAGEGRGDGALQFRIVQHRVALPIGSSLNRAARAHHFNAMPSTTNEMQQWAASPKKSTASASSDTDTARRPPASSVPNMAASMTRAAHNALR